MTLTILQFTLRLFTALALGSLVGLERQWRQRMAGTRTNALVAAGAAAFVMCGFLLENDPGARSRMASYVVSGVGFLGAGVIFKDGGSVRGLNTAATIWCSAAIGVLSGLAALPLAFVLAIAVLFTNLVLRPLAYRLHPVLPAATPEETVYAISLVCRTSAVAPLRALLLATISRSSVVLQAIHSGEDESVNQTSIRAEVMTGGRNNEAVEEIVMRLSIEDAVDSLSWSILQSTLE
jgi:putative Mg2+ transporter-C (MgtC) family protein